MTAEHDGPVSVPFTDPISGRECFLVLADLPKVRHGDCATLADVTLELDAFYCPVCRRNGRISGAWVMDVLEHPSTPAPSLQALVELEEVVRIVVGWDHDAEQSYFDEVGPLVDDDDDAGLSGRFAATVPKVLWDRYWASLTEIHRLAGELEEAAGVAEGRRIECCPSWDGEAMPAHEFWQVVLSRSADDDTWPLRDVSVDHFDDEAAAQAFIESLPDTFTVVVNQQHLVPIDRDRLTVVRAGWPGSVSSCRRCGWDREEHPADVSDWDAL